MLTSVLCWYFDSKKEGYIMRIGIPSEVKVQETRVALIPDACTQLQQQGHDLVIQSGAGAACGYPDTAYQTYNIPCYADAASVYEHAELLIKVKEPQPQEYARSAFMKIGNKIPLYKQASMYKPDNVLIFY